MFLDVKAVRRGRPMPGLVLRCILVITLGITLFTFARMSLRHWDSMLYLALLFIRRMTCRPDPHVTQLFTLS